VKKKGRALGGEKKKGPRCGSVLEGEEPPSRKAYSPRMGGKCDANGEKGEKATRREKRGFVAAAAELSAKKGRYSH